ncbi:MAG: 23S rRNA (adenine(2503)-C(2))-methyltransferase RlmN [Candidatus Omnitrophica bacterium]|nr:23S rRNA (adenine(2503)-C(2))-methyltransferase RlmN [Candidatus Omnitrophota bacterium]
MKKPLDYNTGMLGDIKGFTREELRRFFAEEGFAKFSSSQIFNWIYKKRVEDFSLMTNLSKSLRDFLPRNFYFSKLELKDKAVSEDKTEKFLFKLKDSSLIETVLIPEPKRNTLCLSTQVGCKFKCSFCVSGLSGFKRNLEVSEMVNQFLYLSDYLKPAKVTNAVFMGIGEPLDNLENLIKAVKIIMDEQGIYLGKRKICISTAGLASKIRNLADLGLGVGLSVSLHCADDQRRSRIMPINKRYSLEELTKALLYFTKKEKKPVTLEYILIKELNSSREDAVRLSRLARKLNCKINLIPYNPCEYFEWQAPDKSEIEGFTKALKEKNTFFTLRKARGRDIEASCGQLRSRFEA